MFNSNKDKVKVRTIKFEKIKVLKVLDDSTGYLEYKSISDSYINIIVYNYVINEQPNIKLKSIKIDHLHGTIKCICTKKEIYELYLYLIYKCNDTLTNLRYK